MRAYPKTWVNATRVLAYGRDQSSWEKHREADIEIKTNFQYQPHMSASTTIWAQTLKLLLNSYPGV